MEKGMIFENLFDHLGDMAVYVIRRDDRRILYFNEKVREVAPEIEVGQICGEIWAGTCDNCPVDALGEKEFCNTINFDDPFGEVVDLMAAKTFWGEERIPAFVVTVKPHSMLKEDIRLNRKRKLRETIANFTLEGAVASEYEEILYFNLTEEQLIYRKQSSRTKAADEGEALDFEQFVSTLHPEDREEYRRRFSREALLRLFCSGVNTQYMEYRKLGNDNRFHWYSNTVVKAESQGDITAFMLNRNIDERKRLEDEKNDLISCIMTLFGELLLVDIRTGEFQIYKSGGQLEQIKNETEYRMLNRMYGEALIHPVDRRRFYDAFALESIQRSVRQGKRKIILEVRRKDRAGNYRFCELIGIILEDRDGRAANMVLTYRDTNELVRARMEQEKANQRFARAVNDTYDAIYEGELYGDWLKLWKQAEGSCCFHFNPSIEQQIEWAVNEVIHPDYREEYLCQLSKESLKKAFESGKSEVTIQVPRLSGNGVYRWFSMQVQLLEMNTGYIRVMFYLKDVDDVKKEEERKQKELQDALAMAEKANKAKTDFLSRMSHDIRTPMNVIIGMASIAEGSLEDRERIAECLKKIGVSANFLLSLINDILDMSKIESGKMALLPQQLDFRELLQDITMLCEAQAGAKQQIFRAEISEKTGRFFIGDSLRLRQILLNLLSNALKYTPERGRVTLSVDVEREDERQQFLRIRVSDTGIGMTSDFMVRMFEPFEQGYSGGGRVFEGTGLGLSITRKLVELMDGTIDVESSPGRGSVFTVQIRLEKAAEAGGPRDASHSPQRGMPEDGECEEGAQREGERQGPAEPFRFDGQRVLLVEDNELNREIAEILLQNQGLTVDCAVDCAVDGREAVEQFKRSPCGYYKAVLMDIRMPVMDGFEATRQIRALNRGDAASVPIIAMTANAFRDEREEAYRVGINDYLTKPIDSGSLHDCLRKHIGRQREAEKGKIDQKTIKI